MVARLLAITARDAARAASGQETAAESLESGGALRKLLIHYVNAVEAGDVVADRTRMNGHDVDEVSRENPDARRGVGM